MDTGGAWRGHRHAQRAAPDETCRGRAAGFTRGHAGRRPPRPRLAAPRVYRARRTEKDCSTKNNIMNVA